MISQLCLRVRFFRSLFLIQKCYIKKRKIVICEPKPFPPGNKKASEEVASGFHQKEGCKAFVIFFLSLVTNYHSAIVMFKTFSCSLHSSFFYLYLFIFRIRYLYLKKWSQTQESLTFYSFFKAKRQRITLFVCAFAQVIAFLYFEFSSS